MKTIIPALCMTLGLAAGAVAGHYHGVAVTLQAAIANQMTVYEATAAEIESKPIHTRSVKP